MELQFKIPAFDTLRVESELSDRSDRLRQFRAKIEYLNLADQFLRVQDTQPLNYSGTTGLTDTKELFTVYSDRLQLVRLQKQSLQYEGFAYVLEQLKHTHNDTMEVRSYQFQAVDFHLFVAPDTNQVIAILKRNREAIENEVVVSES